MPWLLTLLLLALIPLFAHVRYKWRGEEREWQGPLYQEEEAEEEGLTEEPPPSPVLHAIGTLLCYCAVLACLGLLVYLLAY